MGGDGSPFWAGTGSRQVGSKQEDALNNTLDLQSLVGERLETKASAAEKRRAFSRLEVNGENLKRVWKGRSRGTPDYPPFRLRWIILAAEEVGAKGFVGTNWLQALNTAPRCASQEGAGAFLKGFREGVKKSKRNSFYGGGKKKKKPD